MMAKLMMADELTKLQDIYLHAVARHVLLQREVDAYIASVKAETREASGGVKSGAKASGGTHVVAGGVGLDVPSVPSIRRRRGTQSRSAKGRRRDGGIEDWRERLLLGAAKKAPPVSCVKMKGDLRSIR